MRVELTALAERDLLDIALYIAADNPARALSFVDELQAACEGLASQALRFPVMAGFEASAIRRRVYGRYGIFYTIGVDRVQILRVISAAMDIESVLEGD
ncbi:type II toxin-antitoxin system RelE/ParE family toxin [Devosia sp. FKR38]|uniref:type II toxin-antitoxin system RelE/ParE family toxin n=1 Tax=Devosia sp. FKR38 TaxID=2562312 RepID=UPI0010C12C93|nr:type II toxin-antitoxin system RelE/ParE family toxin [Devosia sp. FKR38]